MNSIPQKIKRYRLLRNLTQAYMAQKLKISVKWYNKFENGKTRIYIDQLERIAHILQVDLRDLIELGYPQQHHPEPQEIKDNFNHLIHLLEAFQHDHGQDI